MKINLKKILKLKYLIILVFFVSCQSNSNEKKLLEREKELLRKEKEMLVKENEILKSKQELKIEPIKKITKEKKKIVREFKVSENSVKNEFLKNIKNIEDNYSETSINEIFIGDLNEDGLIDGLVHYRKEANQGGNGNVGNGLAIFLNKDNKLNFLLKKEDLDDFLPKEIKGNYITGEKLKYGPDDPNCCPSIKKKSRLKLFPGKQLLFDPKLF